MFGVSNGSVMKVKVFYLKNEKILLSIVVFPVCIEFSAIETKCALKRQILFHTLYVHFSSKKHLFKNILNLYFYIALQPKNIEVSYLKL